MPPVDYGKTITAEQKEMIRRWIEQGADWQQHWAFIAPSRPELPQTNDTSWAQGAIDAFVLAKLEKEKLSPSPIADKETLLRRVTFDLTGLPPTLAEIDAFLADDSANAYEKVVDRLLQSPHYGEHMARFWLDAARYGDTHGLHLDNYREIWPYRDWVVRSFNSNQPFDQFTIEQIAGDLLPEATLEQKIATGFNRCNVSTSEGGSIAEEVYVRNVVDRVTTTGTVFLGLTLECSRCHDHKFDPFTMNDFYSLFAYFNNIDGPALDGNVKDTQPSIPAPNPDQVAEMQQIQQQIDHLIQQQDQQQNSSQQPFLAWLDKQRQTANSDTATKFTAPHEGLLGHFPLDLNAENKVSDQVSSDRHGQATGEATSVAGQYGNAVKLTNQAHLDLGDVFEFEHDKTFSISVWVDLPEKATGTILSKINDDNRGYALLAAEGKVAVALNNRSDDRAIRVTTQTEIFNQPGWHHLLVSYDGSSKASGIEIFVDGARQPLDVIKDAIADRNDKRSIDSGDAHFLIGKRSDGNGFAAAQIDELRIYDRILSQAEVTKVMLADAVGHLVQLPSEQTSPEQQQTLRDYYIHAIDPALLELSTQEQQHRSQLTKLKQSLPISLVYRERNDIRDAFFLNRGEYDQKGDKVDRATPPALHALPEQAPHNRLGLAQWLVDRQNPLTARVTVNRFWGTTFWHRHRQNGRRLWLARRSTQPPRPARLAIGRIH